MSTMLDIVGALVLFGVLIVTIARVQSNLNQASFQNSFSVITQRNATELARQIEYDFTKIGFKIPVQRILHADTNQIRFRSDLLNNGTIDTIKYSTGVVSEAAITANPFDFPLKRRNRNGEVTQQRSLRRFFLRYYDFNHSRISTPITDIDSLAKIYAINVFFTVEGREAARGGDTTYYAVSWQKLIYPRNLSN